jgi:uncharacterized protein YoaH (UPF0181 family)
MNSNFAVHKSNKVIKMTTNNVHTVKHPDGWANVRPHSERASSVHSTQQQAIERGRELAQKSNGEHLIHRVNGQIRARNTYGTDPFPPKG